MRMQCSTIFLGCLGALWEPMIHPSARPRINPIPGPAIIQYRRPASSLVIERGQCDDLARVPEPLESRKPMSPHCVYDGRGMIPYLKIKKADVRPLSRALPVELPSDLQKLVQPRGTSRHSPSLLQSPPPTGETLVGGATTIPHLSIRVRLPYRTNQDCTICLVVHLTALEQLLDQSR